MTSKKELRYRKKGGQTGPLTTVLYLRPNKLDGRTWPAKDTQKIATALLDGFPNPPPPRVQIIAQLAGFKIFQINCYKSHALAGVIEATETMENYCLALMNSALRDILALEQLARHYAPTERTLTLQEYLRALQEGRLIEVEGGNGK